MDKKDFKKWHEDKSNLHEHKVRPFFHEREIWFCSLGINIGFEQDGRGNQFLRPVVIIRKFNNEICWSLPLTKKEKKGQYYFQFKFKKDKVSTIVLSQIRLMDGKRLQYKIGEMSESDFDALITKLKALLP